MMTIVRKKFIDKPFIPISLRIVKKNNGFSLAVVIVTFLVLSIFGLAFLAVSSAEANFTSRQYNRTQAYYSAKSGAEVAYEHLEEVWMRGYINDGKNDSDYIYSVDDLFTKYANTASFTGSICTDNSDSFVTNFQFDSSESEKQIKILSNSVQNDVPASTALKLELHFPSRLPLDWINSGGIVANGDKELPISDGAAVLNPRKIFGHYVKKSSNPGVVWKATRIHFESKDPEHALDVNDGSLTIQTHMVSFDREVIIKDESVGLILEDYNGEGFKEDSKVNGDPESNLENPDWDWDQIPDGWGVLFVAEGMTIGGAYPYHLDSGYYAYKPGIKMNDLYFIEYDPEDPDADEYDPDFDPKKYTDSYDHEDLGAHLKKITDTKIQAFIDKVIASDTGYYSEYKIWSAN